MDIPHMLSSDHPCLTHIHRDVDLTCTGCYLRKYCVRYFPCLLITLLITFQSPSCRDNDWPDHRASCRRVQRYIAQLSEGPAPLLGQAWISLQDFLDLYVNKVCLRCTVFIYMNTHPSQIKALIPWATGAIADPTAIRDIGLTIKLTYHANAPNSHLTFTLDSYHPTPRCIIVPNRSTLPEEWTTPDCGLVEFVVHVPDVDGPLHVIRSYHNVLPREQLHIRCFGQAQRHFMLFHPKFSFSPPPIIP